MTAFRFTKMSGAGNDFVVLDNRSGALAEEGRRARIERWCERRNGIGADGALLVEPPEGADAHFRMRYYNADGGEADSCGNGARCIARFAHLLGAAPDDMRFETRAGLYRAEVVGEDIRLTMSDPHSLRRDVAVDLSDLSPDIAAAVAGPPCNGRVDYVNTGVPHVVAFVEDLEAVPVDALGRRLRFHEAFAPAGTNVNFAKVVGPDRIAVRTYERGVEGETLACGTGSVAVALIASLKGLAASPVSILTRGGPVLKIHFDRATGNAGVEESGNGSGGFTNVRLEGEARVVFTGEVVA